MPIKKLFVGLTVEKKSWEKMHCVAFIVSLFMIEAASGKTVEIKIESEDLMKLFGIAKETSRLKDIDDKEVGPAQEPETNTNDDIDIKRSDSRINKDRANMAPSEARPLNDEDYVEIQNKLENQIMDLMAEGVIKYDKSNKTQPNVEHPNVFKYVFDG
ncbi:hypothetical protein O0L34_g17299 [Tuta absoluta]|nr:hypothetical protein O0L34_g17299 [Tuta absoluta]